MKTKHIFKVGVLSIILLLSLINPVLKFNNQRVNAAPLQEDQQTNSVSPDQATLDLCVKLYDNYKPADIVSVFAFYDKCCSSNYSWPQEDERDFEKRCNKAKGIVDVVNKPEYGLIPPTSEQIESFIKEVDTTTFCDELYGSHWWEAPPFVSKNWWGHMFCTLQVSAINGLGEMFGSMIKALSGYITWAMHPNTYGGFVQNSAVRGIWAFLKDQMNLILVLVVVIIAIATILGVKKYRWQETLWKLIVVALLINFSLIIPGVILDLSHFLSFTFINLATMDDVNIAESILKAMQADTMAKADMLESTFVVDMNKTDETTGEKNINPSGWGLGMGRSLLAAVSIILVGLFSIISLLAVLGVMIFRAFMIIILLCVSPVVFAAWIFPATEKYWKMWWNQFIKWCTFPIFFALTLYMGLYVAKEITIAPGPEGVGIIEIIVQLILFSMFLVGGLIFSVQAGGATSQAVTKLSGKLAVGAGALLGTKTLKGITGTGAWQKIQKTLEESKITPLHDLGVSIGEIPKKIRATELKRFEDYYKHASDEQIRRDLQAHKGDKARVAVGLNQLAERKKIDYDKDSEFVNIARSQPNLNVSGLKKAHPELYIEYFSDPKDMQNAITKVRVKYPGIPKDKAKDRAVTELLVDQVLKSSADNIKSGNWANIFERLAKKGESDKFFEDLLKQNLPAPKLAAMLNSIDDTTKQKDFADGIIKSIMAFNIGSTQQDAINYLQNIPSYQRNPVIRRVFNL
jgi:hypothetical protein